ncbi:hypothetical protein [Streptococcus suis]|uniref:hypothetical protein n=1 Tax=Streptococcus suis TaxID=1307 RepID=UPI001E5CE26D|nr:hypothetical protein [Streptococcus suis]
MREGAKEIPVDTSDAHAFEKEEVKQQKAIASIEKQNSQSGNAWLIDQSKESKANPSHQ